MSVVTAKTMSSRNNRFNSEAADQQDRFIKVDGEYFEVLIAEDEASIESLKSDWLKLEAKNDDFTYFQSFDWCRSWVNIHCEHPQSLFMPRVYSLARHGEIILVLPMMVERRKGLNIMRVLSEPLGQYSNILAAKDQFTPMMGEKLLEHIQRNEDVDAILFVQYPEGYFLDQMISNRGFEEQVETQSSIANFDGFEDWETYQAEVLPAKLRKERRRRLNKLNREGHVSYRVVLGGSEAYEQMVIQALNMKAEWLIRPVARPLNYCPRKQKPFYRCLRGVTKTIICRLKVL